MIPYNNRISHESLNYLQCTTDNLKCSELENLVQIIRTSNYMNKCWYKKVKNTESGPRK